MGAYLSISTSTSSTTTTTTVTCTLYYHGNGTSYNYNNPKWKITFNGSTKSGTHDFTASTGAQKLGSASWTVSRATAAKSLTPKATFATGVSLGTLSKTGSAVSIPALPKYTLSASAGTGGSVSPTSQSIYYGYSGTVTATPSTGYSFSKWSTGSTSSTLSVKVTAATSVSASFVKNSYNLSLLTPQNGSISGSSGSIAYDTACTLTAVPNTGYHFVNWTNGKTGTTNPLSFNMPASALNIGATFAPNTYTVILNNNLPNGASTSQTDSATYDIEKVPAYTPTADGYIFKGWTIDKREPYAYQSTPSYINNKILNLTTTNNDTVTVYAVWEINAYNITYDGNGATSGTVPAIQQQKPSESTTIASSVNLVRTGYTRSSPEWYYYDTDGTKRECSNGNTITFTKSTTLFAAWIANTYKVHFHPNYGTDPYTTQTLTYDKTVTLNLNTFTRTGYHFMGWSISSSSDQVTYRDGASVINLKSEQNDIINLYAVWQANTYTISFNLNGSNEYPVTSASYPATTIKFNEPYSTIKPQNPKRLGHKFDKWEIDGQEIDLDHDIYNIAEDSTLTATWAPNSYTIEFDLGSLDNTKWTAIGKQLKENSTILSTSVLCTVGNYIDFSEITNPVRIGYEFKGWDGKYFQATSNIKDLSLDETTVILTAKWQENITYPTLKSVVYDRDNNPEHLKIKGSGTPFSVINSGSTNYTLSPTTFFVTNNINGQNYVTWGLNNNSGGSYNIINTNQDTAVLTFNPQYRRDESRDLFTSNKIKDYFNINNGEINSTNFPPRPQVSNQNESYNFSTDHIYNMTIYAFCHSYVVKNGQTIEIDEFVVPNISSGFISKSFYIMDVSLDGHEVAFGRKAPDQWAQYIKLDEYDEEEIYYRYDKITREFEKVSSDVVTEDNFQNYWVNNENFNSQYIKIYINGYLEQAIIDCGTWD